MAASEAVILKNDCGLLPIKSPEQLLATANRKTDNFQAAIASIWPDCNAVLPATSHPVRLATQARQYVLALQLQWLRQEDDLKVSRRERTAMEKLGRMKQTITVLLSTRPVALEHWHKAIPTLVWAPASTSLSALLEVIAGRCDGGKLPFPMPSFNGQVKQLDDGEWLPTGRAKPVFPAGFGLSLVDVA